MESPLIKDFAGFVNGRWARGSGGSSIAVTNPATGELLATVPDMGSDDTRTHQIHDDSGGKRTRRIIP